MSFFHVLVYLYLYNSLTDMRTCLFDKATYVHINNQECLTNNSPSVWCPFYRIRYINKDLTMSYGGNSAT